MEAEGALPRGGNGLRACDKADAAVSAADQLIGGGRIAYYLAKQLVEAGLDVKIIESDPARCEELSVLLPKAEILCGDGTNEAFLRKCGIETTGAVAALTGIDEENVLIGMYIRKTWPKRAKELNMIAILRVFLIDSMALDSALSAKNLKPDAIDILPGLMPSMLRKVRQLTGLPILTGGLITEKKEVMQALEAGALAISSTAPAVWEM